MMTSPIVYTSEDDMDYIVPCVVQAECFISTLTTKTRWFFQKCLAYFKEDRYIFYYTSYDLPEYKDFLVILEFKFVNEHYIPKLICHHEPEI